MLTHIHIRDFAIIDELNLDFSAGMTVLTGETGAGKSILLDAIGLVLGDKADSSMIRHAAERAEITLTIDISHNSIAQEWLQTQELYQDEGCILRRVLTSQGKSRAWINGSPCTLTQLRQLGELLVDIHGQHEHQSLMKRDSQRQLLDEYAGNDTLLTQVSHTWHQWKNLNERLARLSQQSHQQHERVELLRFQINELEQLALQDNEITTLDEEHSVLANADQLRSAAEWSFHQLYEAEPSLYSQLTQIHHTLAQQSHLDTRLNQPLELITSLQIQLQEAALTLRDYAQDLDVDPHRLQWVEQRMADIRHLARKYRLEAGQLTHHLAQLRAELALFDSADYDLDALNTSLHQAREQYTLQAAQLSQARHTAAQTLAHGVTQALQPLGMQGGQFTIQLHPHTNSVNQYGNEHIEFMVSTNPGQPLKPLVKVASGGELSRISLAIQMMAAQRLSLPALIFDEVDTGIGGGIAEVVGKQLRQLGMNRQVLCVTHLPQVASQAHQHYKVVKTKTDATTHTAIERLTGQARVTEIARMMGGMAITPTTIALATEMLTHDS